VVRYISRSSKFILYRPSHAWNTSLIGWAPTYKATPGILGARADIVTYDSLQ